MTDMITEKFHKDETKQHFSISTQHYSFVVDAFVMLTKELEINSYDLSVDETKTAEIIENVKNLRSELGILYLDSFNRKPLTKTLKENGLEFEPLYDCPVYVFIGTNHPLAKKKKITFDELAPYPCLAFDQGEDNAFYFSEEVLSTEQYPRKIRANDRATMVELMIGLNGYTLGSGILVNELTDTQFVAIPFDTDDVMTIGYIHRKNMPLSDLAQRYLEILNTYVNK